MSKSARPERMNQTERIEPLTLETIETNLERDKHHIEAAISTDASAHVTADGLIAGVMYAARNSGQFLKCGYGSILFGTLLAARTGLPIGPPLNRSYLIPRYTAALGNFAQWEPSYQGLRTLARRSGVIATWQSEVVREGDEFSYRYGDDDFIAHKPAPGSKDRKLLYAYTITTFLNGAKRTFTVMDADEVAHIRSSSDSAGFD